MTTARYQLLSPVEPTAAGWRLLHGVKSGSVAWRLLGANNRELGRSVGVFPDREACEKAIVSVVEQLPLAAVVISHDNGSGTWTWRLDGSDGAIARSARGYARQRECRYGLAVFLDLAGQS